MIFNLLRSILHGTALQDTRFFSFCYTLYVKYLQFRLPTDEACVLVEFRYSKFWIPKNDITILPTLIRSTYENKELDEVLQLVQSCDSFIDVGANVGIYTILCAQSAELNGGIYSFEPNPAVVRVLERNLGMLDEDDRQRISVFQLALAESEGTAEFTASEFHGTGRLSTLSEPGNIEVRKSTLDAVFEGLGGFPKNALVKIDVEGFEPQVLLGARRFINGHQPRLLVEVCGANSSSAKCDWSDTLSLIDRNYRTMKIWGPASKNDDSRSSIATRLARLIDDGRLHNVLISC